MTHSSHRFATLSADDVALCRAHSRAVATPPNVRAAVHSMCAAMSDCKQTAPQLPADLPLPPSYWDDLEHWLKTLAPAKPAATGDAPVSAKQPEPYADVWHSEDPSVAGVYLTKPECSDMKVARARWWDGSEWHMNPEQRKASSDKARSMPVRKGELFGKLQWLRLIEADAPATKSEIVDASLARLASTSSAADGAVLIGERPAEPRTIPVPWDQWHEKAMRDMVKLAQQPAQKASTHSVCIRAYGPWNVGEVAWWNGAPQAIPANWLPCDESGWVTHMPTADAVCPVPRGVLFSVRMRDGQESAPGTSAWSWGPACDGTIIAWRPIAQS